MKVRIPTPLRSYTGQQAVVEAGGDTVSDVLDDLDRQFPGIRFRMVDEQNRLERVDVAGVLRNVNIGLLDGDGTGAVPGDWVLIHVGFAMSRVDEEEARATLGLLQQMGEAYEQELEDLKASVIE